MNINGSCYALVAFDIGQQVDLDKSAKLMTVATHRMTVVPRHRAPKHFEYRSSPLRLTQRADSLSIAGFSSQGAVDVTLFEFGSVSLTYRIPFQTDLMRLLDLSDALYDNAVLRTDAELRVKDLLETIHSAVVKPTISGDVEDYLVFEIARSPDHPPVEKILSEHGQEVAQILRSERLPLSMQQISDALEERLSYSPNDTAIINWNAAFLYSDDVEDVRAVLELVNVQLLEMRYLDRQLDASLEQSYDILTKQRTSRFNLFNPLQHDLERITQLQVDGALLFEGVSNAIKLLGDQYLARIYRLAARRFHLAEWDGNITRKLNALESVHQKIEGRVDSMRMQIMELIIVLLILFEIVLPWFRR
jgi:hypothetical protein